MRTICLLCVAIVSGPVTADDPPLLRAVRVETLADGIDSGTGGLAIDRKGNLYTADFGWRLDGRGKGGDKVFKVTPDGTATLFCREMRGASGNHIDKSGNLYQSSIGGNFISRVTPDGNVEVLARKGFRNPVGITAGPDGFLYVNNCGAGSISRVTPDGEATEFCRSDLLKCPNGITLADDGNFYVANFSNGDVIRVTPEGKASRLVTLPGNNNGHITSHKGHLYVVARTANQIYQVTLSGQARAFVGSGARGKSDGSPLSSSLSLPNDLCFSPDGKYLYINETAPIEGDPRILGPTRIRRVSVTSEPATDSEPAVASINDLAWIAGHWVGEALGGRFEETWSPPLGGEMLGSFKLVKGGKPAFYEILTIVPNEKSLTLRLKHFNPGLVGWEDKDKSVEFPLMAVTQNEAVFNGLIFRRLGPDRMDIIVRTDSGELLFECHRAGTDARAIRMAFEADKALAKQRDAIPKKQPLANAVSLYVLGIDGIDFSRCPKDFTAAFRKHRDAWAASEPYFKQHADLRGDMHDLFDQIKQAGGPAADQLELHSKAIFSTWAEVEVIAAKYGVK